MTTLIDKRYYRVYIYGWGGESAYMHISKEAHNFWEYQPQADLVHYMLNAEDDELDYDDFEEVDDIPLSAQFLRDADGQVCAWYDSRSEFHHCFGGDLDSCRITVEEIAGDDLDADVTDEIVIGKCIQEWSQEIEDETDFNKTIWVADSCDEPDNLKYIAQMNSSEKGCFVYGIIETTGDFDPTKLTVNTTEYLDGDNIIESVSYDGNDIDNDGGDTSGKGYNAQVWQQC